jgi:hypothetical protein
MFACEACVVSDLLVNVLLHSNAFGTQPAQLQADSPSTGVLFTPHIVSCMYLAGMTALAQYKPLRRHINGSCGAMYLAG